MVSSVFSMVTLGIPASSAGSLVLGGRQFWYPYLFTLGTSLTGSILSGDRGIMVFLLSEVCSSGFRHIWDDQVSAENGQSQKVDQVNNSWNRESDDVSGFSVQN